MKIFLSIGLCLLILAGISLAFHLGAKLEKSYERCYICDNQPCDCEAHNVYGRNYLSLVLSILVLVFIILNNIDKRGDSDD